MTIAPDVSVVIPFPTIHEYDRPLWDDFLSRVNSESFGRFYLIHMILPHHPYELDRDGGLLRNVKGDEGFDDLPQMARQYAEQVGFVDTLLGELVSKLRGEGLYDRALLIVTADHGPRSLGLGEKYAGYREHPNYPAVLSEIVPSVPLFIHGDGVEPGVSDVAYQHIDFTPTVLDLLGISLTQRFEGVSAISGSEPSRDKQFFGFPAPPSELATVTYNYRNGVWERESLPLDAW